LLFKPGNTLDLADTLSRAFLSGYCQDAKLLEKLDTVVNFSYLLYYVFGFV